MYDILYRLYHPLPLDQAHIFSLLHLYQLLCNWAKQDVCHWGHSCPWCLSVIKMPFNLCAVNSLSDYTRRPRGARNNLILCFVSHSVTFMFTLIDVDCPAWPSSNDGLQGAVIRIQRERQRLEDSWYFSSLFTLHLFRRTLKAKTAGSFHYVGVMRSDGWNV